MTMEISDQFGTSHAEIFDAEYEYLMKHAKGKTILEIGTYQGGTARALAHVAKLVYTIDKFQYEDGDSTIYKKFWEKWTRDDTVKLLSNYPNIIILSGDSKEIIPLLPDNYFDLVFIDGDHTREGVKVDFINSYPKVKEDGTFVFHDYKALDPEDVGVYSFIVNDLMRITKVRNRTTIKGIQITSSFVVNKDQFMGLR